VPRSDSLRSTCSPSSCCCKQLSLSLSLSLSLTLSLSHTHCLSLTHTHTLALSLSLTVSLSLTHTHIHSLSLFKYSHATHTRNSSFDGKRLKGSAAAADAAKEKGVGGAKADPQPAVDWYALAAEAQREVLMLNQLHLEAEEAWVSERALLKRQVADAHASADGLKADLLRYQAEIESLRHAIASMDTAQHARLKQSKSLQAEVQRLRSAEAESHLNCARLVENTEAAKLELEDQRAKVRSMQEEVTATTALLAAAKTEFEDARGSKEELGHALSEEEAASRVLAQVHSLVQGYFADPGNDADSARIWQDLTRVYFEEELRATGTDLSHVIRAKLHEGADGGAWNEVACCVLCVTEGWISSAIYLYLCLELELYLYFLILIICVCVQFISICVDCNV
jgi:hypothetical protein